jgi:protein ImuA
MSQLRVLSKSEAATSVFGRTRRIMVMSAARKLVALRSHIERIEAHGAADRLRKVPLGHAEADAHLQGGLALGAMHEVFAEVGRQSAVATGFVAGLAGRVAARRPVVWIRQDFTEVEAGMVSMSGFSELGLDPRLLVTVRAIDVDQALRTTADALACDAVGAVVLEVWGEAKQIDLVASRKLTLAAQASGATGLMLRLAAEPRASTAESRWIVRAAHSPPASHPSSAWGSPLFEAQLVRNRHGPTGRWIMEWKCDECLFGQPAAHPQPVAAAPAYRSHQAQSVFKRSGYRVA